MPAPIAGTCDARFSAVEDAFAANFSIHAERGGAVCVVVDGEVVVDLWGGHADEGRTRPWAPDTLVDVFSVGKALVAVGVARLCGQGRLDLDEPMWRWWPGFDHQNKSSITLRQVLSHTAGLPAVRERLGDDAVYSPHAMRDALAATAPFWPPGSAIGYHVNTFGFLAGAAIERATGRSVGTYLDAEVCAPLGADLHVGLHGEALGRVAHFDWPRSEVPAAASPSELDEMRHLAYFNPSTLSGLGVVNSARWRRCEHPSANAHGSARGLARLFAALVAGGTLGESRVVDPGALAEATTEAAAGDDLILDRPSRFGLGLQLSTPLRPFGGPRAYGHFGAGGSLGCCDPDRGVAVGYVTATMGPRWQNPRNRGLLAALAGSLG